MEVEEKVKTLVKLGISIGRVLDGAQELTPKELRLGNLIHSVVGKNQWFTSENVSKALREIREQLKEDSIVEWMSHYVTELSNKRTSVRVGIVMAGNIPLVGFHDLLCVFLSGDKAHVKLSSDDNVLLPALVDLMEEIDDSTKKFIIIEEGFLKGVEKVIATGSNNTSRYFEYYFRNIPCLIRKSRTSVAVVEPSDDDQVIKNLSKDIFTYFGLGCRSISKIFLPENFDLTHFITELRRTKGIDTHQKYLNNLEYHKSVLLINSTPFLDGGFFLLKEDEGLFSPISVLFYERYNDIKEVDSFIAKHQQDIQCVVNSKNRYGILPGESQSPELYDYADGVDVMKFLLND